MRSRTVPRTNDQHSQFGIVAIVGSPGGGAAMREILRSLPSTFPVPILYFQHLRPDYGEALLGVLQQRTQLQIRWVEPCDSLGPNTVDLVPADMCGLVLGDRPRALVSTETRRDARDAASELLPSVAAHYSHRALVIVLAGAPGGAGMDGLDGLREVRARKGVVLVQNGNGHGFPAWGMASAAVEAGCVDAVLHLHEIAPSLVDVFSNGHPVIAIRSPAAADPLMPPRLPAYHNALGQLLDQAMTTLGTDLGNIQLVNSAKDELTIVAQRGFGRDFLEHFRTVRMQDDSACGRALRTRSQMLIPDVVDDPLFAPHRDVAGLAGFRAVQSTPIVSRNDGVLGVLSTHFRSPRSLLPWEARRIEQHARLVAEVIERSRET